MPRLDHLLPILLSLALAGPAAQAAEARPPKAPAPQSQGEARPAPAKPASPPASPEENPYEERFRQLDRDGDGYVSPAEWPLDPARFATVDRNEDGRLSRNELLTPNTLRRRDRQFQDLDTSGDGRLSARERQRGGSALERLDRNRDGYVSRGEYAAADPENAWGTHVTPRAQSRFRDLDRNSDNRLGPLELTGPAARFHNLDFNRDGFISPSEWTRR
jgi:hypothetical protein